MDKNNPVVMLCGKVWHIVESGRESDMGACGRALRERRRKTYSLTDAGRAALRDWLASPTHEHFLMRDVAELKLFFNEAGDPATDELSNR